MKPSPSPRFVLIDALRGVAALGVFLFHLSVMSALTPTLDRVFGPGKALLVLGEYGVQIFFVLSGFVIAHSLRNEPVSRDALANFIVRRQLRLDPPYWMALVLTLIFKGIGLRLASDLKIQAFPGASAISAHLLYLQGFARLEPILVVAWTLCLELQFYLIFMLLLALSARGSEGSGQPARADIPRAAALVFGLGVVSLGLALWGGQPFGGHGFGGERTAWFIYYWYYFAAGALCYWAWRGALDVRVFRGWMALMVAATVIAVAVRLPVSDRANTPVGLGVGVASVLLIYLAGKSGAIWSWGGQRVWQYLGRISYSLYLVHVPVLASVMRVGFKLTGDRGAAAVLWFALTGVICILAAHLFYVAVERPSMRWVARFKRHPQAPQPSELKAPAPESVLAIG